jgi:hypothetical protein
MCRVSIVLTLPNINFSSSGSPVVSCVLTGGFRANLIGTSDGCDRARKHIFKEVNRMCLNSLSSSEEMRELFFAWGNIIYFVLNVNHSHLALFRAVFLNLFVTADPLYRMLIPRRPHKTQNGFFLYLTYHKNETVTYNFTTLNVSFMTIKYCYKWRYSEEYEHIN